MNLQAKQILSSAVADVVGAGARQSAPRGASIDPASDASVDAGARQSAPVSAGVRKNENEKTNPPRSLSHRQLAAVRLLATGLTATDVADRLGMSRSGLLKWRKQTAFVAELYRTHKLMAATVASQLLR
jgi:DNA-binding NarL/FixJ family response regulator